MSIGKVYSSIKSMLKRLGTESEPIKTNRWIESVYIYIVVKLSFVDAQQATYYAKNLFQT